MLHPVDYVLIVVFLFATVAIGILSRGKQGSTADYYISKGSLPGFIGNAIIGLSIAATFFSGISLLAYPSVVINHGLVICLAMLTFVANYYLLVYFFAPRFATGEWRTPYQILEYRFGWSARKLSSGLYVLMRLGWMSALIYAPTVAILGATGLGDGHFWTVVLLVGLTSTVYSAFGGLRGIMVTDALQMLVIIGGCLTTVGFIVFNLPVSLGEAFARLGETGSTRVFDFSTDISITVTTWSVLIGGLCANTAMYFGDQMALQRYLTSPSIREVRRSFLINVVGVIVILSILAVIGLSLKAWMLYQDPAGLPEDTDRIFPFYVASQLPPGVAGLILAALLAATMSSMTSGINALSGAIEMDLVPGMGRDWSELKRLRLARVLSFGIGVAATLGAGLVGQLGQIFDITQKLLGLFAGPIGVTLLFAVLPFRIRSGFVIGGLIGGFALGLPTAFSTQLHDLFPGFPVIGSMWTSVVSMLASSVIMAAGIRGWLPDRTAAPE